MTAVVVPAETQPSSPAAGSGIDRTSRQGLLLVCNTVITALLGLSYWGLAARRLPLDAVGTGTAAISAITTISGLAQLNLFTSMSVLLPSTPVRRRRGLVLRIYAFTSVLAAMVAGGVSLVAPLTLGGHGSVLWAAASMVAFAVLWTLFALEDGALIAVHGAWAVLVSNVAFGVAKLIMLVLLPVDGQVDTVLWSWYAPLLVVVPLTNLALLARLRRDRTEAPNAEPVRLARFVTVDYASFLIVQVITTALPVYVVMIAGPESAAVFATCWMVAGSLDLAITNIAIAMSANIARRPAEAARLMRSVALRMAVPMIVIVGLLIVAAPWVLAVFGPRYASDGPPILRLLLLASLLRAVVTFCSATTRSLRRPGTVILMQVTAAAVILGVGLPAMRQWGVLALAVAWLAAQAASAVVSVLLTRRVVRQTSARSTAEPPVAAPR